MKTELLLFALGCFPLLVMGGANDVLFASSFESPPACDMNDDPDYEGTAIDLGNIDDCDSSTLSLPGVLGAINDVDYFQFTGTDTISCMTNPSIEVISSSPVRSCIYFECSAGSTSVTCPMGSTNDTSPSGKLGCCAQDGALTVDSLDCQGLDDSALVVIRIDSAPQACSSYNATLSF